MSRGIETLRYSVHFFGPEDEWDVWCVEPEVQVACFSATYCPDAECHAKELCFKLNTSQKGQGDAPPKTGWLIEDEYGKLCIGMECNKIKWVTFTNPDAIRFARKRDAENAITLWKLNGNAREHSWG